MIEIEVQKLVCDAVIAHGGAAKKLSNRFLVGVCDLLIKLPNRPNPYTYPAPPIYYPVMLMEVKLDKIKHPEKMQDHPITPSVTVPQFKFLTDFAKAGTLCGVMSFIEDRRGKRGLWLKIERVPEYRPGLAFRVGDYGPLGDHTARDKNIVALLQQFAEGK